MINWIFSALLALCCSSCGYQLDWQRNCGSTIVVSYVEGDRTGKLTDAIVRAVHSSGLYTLVNECGDYRLKVDLVDCGEENIGFRYERREDGRETHTLVPNETRAQMSVKVCLIDCKKSCLIAGPIVLQASADFDHEYDSSPDEVNVFSLGQLTDIETARISVYDVVSRKVAEKVVSYLYCCHLEGQLSR